MEFNLYNLFMVIVLILFSFLSIAVGINGIIVAIKFILHGPLI